MRLTGAVNPSRRETASIKAEEPGFREIKTESCQMEVTGNILSDYPIVIPASFWRESRLVQ